MEHRSSPRLPLEIQLLIIESYLQDSESSAANLAAVSPFWQAAVEKQNFARITLTRSRLSEFNSMTYRNRHLVHYLWVCIELDEYSHPREWTINYDDEAVIGDALRSLCSDLSMWQPNGHFLLDISVHSPSDSRFCFNYLTFEPDLLPHQCIDEGWLGRTQASAPDRFAIKRLFQCKISSITEEELDEELEEKPWCTQLPAMPVVTSLLLRQQTRRQWCPFLLTTMISLFPRLKDIHYEPWREWDVFFEDIREGFYRLILRLIQPSRLSSMVLFENFNDRYPSILGCAPFREPKSSLGYEIALASLELDSLAASFLADASHFFSSCRETWTWQRLASLALTSTLLNSIERPSKIGNMLQQAAKVAMRMPKLRNLEIWNGRKGLAALFRYHSDKNESSILWRGTWELDLPADVVEAWEAVAEKHGDRGLKVLHECVKDSLIASHGDAIRHLKLLQTVIRPTSLKQILLEHSFYRACNL